MNTVAISRQTERDLQRLAARRDKAIAVAEEAAAELREAVIGARENGATLQEIADALGISFQRAYQLSQD
jgi:hypothetical protein